MFKKTLPMLAKISLTVRSKVISESHILFGSQVEIMIIFCYIYKDGSKGTKFILVLVVTLVFGEFGAEALHSTDIKRFWKCKRHVARSCNLQVSNLFPLAA